MKNYQNKDGSILNVLHFPGKGMHGNESHFYENINRDVKISPDISIISIMNKPYYDSSVLVAQCEHNNIRLINTGYDIECWVNTLKIPKILEALDLVDTEYCLILDGKDVILVDDLTEEFLNKYKSFNKSIVYNGTFVRFPDTRIEPIQDIIRIPYIHKFLNAGVCIGETGKLKEFYLKSYNILTSKYQDSESEQLIIRIAAQTSKDYVGVDYNFDMFASIHCEHNIEETDSFYIVH